MSPNPLDICACHLPAVSYDAGDAGLRAFASLSRSVTIVSFDVFLEDAL